jgi:hypothetical protein
MGVIVIAALVISLLIPAVSAFATTTVKNRSMSSSGGKETFSAAVHQAKTCSWSSTPKIAKFATTVDCVNGSIRRTAKIPSNKTTSGKTFKIELVVQGKTRTVHQFTVRQNGRQILTSVTEPAANLSESANTFTSAGGLVTLAYSSSNATSCTLASNPGLWSGNNPASVNCQGSYVADITSTTTAKQWTFTFTAMGNSGSSATSTQTLTQSAPVTSPLEQSDNWSGYILPSDAYVTEASGEFTVPSLNCADMPNAGMSMWTGIGGVNSEALLQTGVASTCVSGSQQNSGWFEEYPSNPNQSEPFPGLTVSTGDVIESSVYQMSDGAWETSLADLTTGFSGVMVTGDAWWVVNNGVNEPPLGSTASLTFPGAHTAEWIIEDYMDNESQVALANYGSVTFSDLSTSVPAWSLSTAEGTEIVQNNVVLSTPEPPEGNAFSATYTGP